MRWTRSIDGLGSLTYEERLSQLKLFSLQGRLLRNDLLLVWKIFNNQCSVKFENLFQLAPAHGTRGHPYKIACPHVRLECRRRYFGARVVRTWNSLSAETVLADTIPRFKTLLYKDLGQKLYEFI